MRLIGIFIIGLVFVVLGIPLLYSAYLQDKGYPILDWEDQNCEQLNATLHGYAIGNYQTYSAYSDHDRILKIIELKGCRV